MAVGTSDISGNDWCSPVNSSPAADLMSHENFRANPIFWGQNFSFYVFVLSCVGYVLCASVYMCFVVTCWERADLLALVYGVFCEFVTFPLVSWVRCGT